MKYFFILGSNPTLSVAELLSFFPEFLSYKLLSEEVLIMEFSKEIDEKKVIKELGSVIKIGTILSETKGRVEYDDLGHLFNTKKGQKYKFGISCYTKFKKINPKFLAMEIKKQLKKEDVSIRWVDSKEKTLSSVVVEQNKLTSGGIEVVLIEDAKKILICKTVAVQDFKSLSFRDYNRPARDDKSGMLPPKLAQIMINLAKDGIRSPSLVPLAGNDKVVLLDPFCGSGTVLTESLLMGFKDIVGTDISEKAVADSRKNVEWTLEKFSQQIQNAQYEVEHVSVLDLSEKIEKNSIDIIVTEPYLGPQRGDIDFDKIKKELEELYSGAIKEFDKVLKIGGRVVMLFPVFRIKGQSWQIGPNLNSFKIVDIIPTKLKVKRIIKQTGRNTIVYGRENQRVWREIVVLERK